MATKEQLLKEWYVRIGIAQKAHQYSVESFEGRSRWLGIPTIVLTTIVGTSVFAALGKQGVETWLQIVVGLLSVGAAVLASLQTFLGYSERAERHRVAAAKYGALGRELETFLESPQHTTDETIAELRKRLDAMALESVNPPIPLYRKAWKNWEEWANKSPFLGGSAQPVVPDAPQAARQ